MPDTKEPLHVGGATVNQTPLDWEGNRSNIINAIRDGINKGIDMLCFPELSITGYGCEDLFLSEWLPRKAVQQLPQIIEACSGIAVAVGLPMIFEGSTYNCTCIIQNRKILGVVAKQNLAIDGVHYETRWFKEWKADRIASIEILNQRVSFGDVTFELGEYLFGFEICEDAWRVDRPACNLYKRNVDVICNPSASHFALQKSIDRIQLVIESSKNFECTYVYANLLGNEAGRMIYEGEILIAENGHLLARNSNVLSFGAYTVASTVIGGHQISDFSTPNFENKEYRYEEFTQAVALALFDYLRKSGVKGFVLSLSGGADSSSCAVLVAEMVRRGVEELGIHEFIERIGLEITKDSKIDNTHLVAKILTCAYQETRNSSKESKKAAEFLAKSIGAGFLEWSVDETIDRFKLILEERIGRKLNWDDDDLTLQNIQARSRSPAIWMLANILNCILITTSNRNEGDLGYATMDGDTSGSLAPIAGIDKPFLRNWLKWAEVELGYDALRHVNKLAPTAELRPIDFNQTDEEDLMPYKILLQIERSAIRDHLSPVETFDRLAPSFDDDPDVLRIYITKFYKLWAQNQWKRERLAPSFHLDDFNIDPRTWSRFPILSKNFGQELEDLNRTN